MKRYTKQERKDYLDQWRQSEKPGRQFCDENGIKPSTFYSWLKSEKKQQSTKTFIQVKPQGILDVGNSTQCIILEKKGWRLSIPRGFDQEDITSLFHILGLADVH